LVARRGDQIGAYLAPGATPTGDPDEALSWKRVEWKSRCSGSEESAFECHFHPSTPARVVFMSVAAVISELPAEWAHWAEEMTERRINILIAVSEGADQPMTRGPSLAAHWARLERELDEARTMPEQGQKLMSSPSTRASEPADCPERLAYAHDKVDRDRLEEWLSGNN
jgi:hypothetical protein